MTRSSRPGASRVTISLAVLLSLSLLGAACGSKKATSAGADTANQSPGIGTDGDVVKAPTGDPVSGGRLVYGLDSETDGWDTASSRWSTAGLTVANAVFDPLVAFDKDFVAKPYLLESIEHNDKYDEWTLKVRDGVTFHNGEAFDATALKKNLDYTRKAVLTQAAFKPIDSIEVVDAKTAKVKMSIPWSAFAANLTAQTGMMMAPASIDNPAESVRHPIGTGPFVFDKWIPDNVFSAHKNAGYWRKGLPYLDAVDFKPLNEPQTQYNALITGDVNLISTSQIKIINKLRADGAAGTVQYVQSKGESEEALVMLNTAKAPFDDQRVRMALALATDNPSLADLNQMDHTLIARGPFAKDSKWYIDTDYPEFDLAKAKELISQVVAEKGPISFTLQCTPNTDVLQNCQALAEMWKSAGVSVNINSVEQTKLITAAITGDYQATIWRQFGAPDPDGDSVWWNGANTKPPLALNMSRNEDQVLDAALYVGRTSPNPEERKLAYVTVQQQMAKDIPYVWLSHAKWAIGAQNNVRGITTSTMPDGSTSASVLSGIQRITEVWFQG